MMKIRFCAGIILLLRLAFISGALAQSDEAVSVSGSAIVNAVMEDLAAASGAGDLSMASMGSGRGIEAFCAGDLDAATASRKMTADERADCEANEIAFSELLIGHHIIALITHAEAPAQCLQFDELQDMLRPTASNQVKDWSFAGEDSSDLPLTVWLPKVDDLAYLIADKEIAGAGLRLDGQHYEEAAEAITAVADTAGALALVPWSERLDSEESLKVLQAGIQDLGDCVSPSAENVESESYPFALSLYVYVNRARLESNESLMQLMQFIVAEASAAVIEQAGVIPPSGAIYDLNAAILADEDAVAGASGDVEDFTIPFDLSGEIRIVGAANAQAALNRAGDGLGDQLNVDWHFAGMSAGIGSLCQGEADIVALDEAASAAALEVCAANDIVAVPLQLGAQATVLVANAANESAACLTTEQINMIWRADSAGVVESWADVAGDFPDLPLTLFGLSALDTHSDILVQTAGAVIPPIRRDTEQDQDSLYRAAAVGNVSGGLTYMSWSDYQDALDNNQANIQLVAVDGGSGCVEPNPGAIEEGLYPLSRRASLLVREASLADINVQSFLWNLFNEGNWSALQADGFLSASALELPIIRRDLLSRYADAEIRFPPAEAEMDAEAGGAEEESADE